MEGIVDTVARKAATFMHPASTTRTNAGGILSPAATFKNNARTEGRKIFKDYSAHGSFSHNSFKLLARCPRPTGENFIDDTIYKKTNIS